MREFIIKKNDAGQRLDKFITKAMDIPTSLLYKSIRTKKIKVNRTTYTAALNSTCAHFINGNTREFALLGKVKTIWLALRN